MNVVVIGGGIAGVAAAWAAATAGASVHLFRDRPGASALQCGALDSEPWHQGHEREIDGHVVSFAAALGIWRLGSDFERVVTQNGVVRGARGSDTALLDVTPLAGKSVAVLDVPTRRFDARLLALAASESDWALDTNTHFVAVEVSDALTAAELDYGDWDLAHLFDDPARVDALAERLAQHRGEHAGWLLGPWLGTEAGAAERLRERLGVPVGETTSEPGGAAGARFEAARDRLLGELGVDVTRARVGKITRSADGLVVSHGGTSLPADAVVLATGGIAVGGIRLDAARPEHPGGACFHPSVDAELFLELAGESVERVSTLHGVDFTAVGLAALENVGVATSDGVAALGHDKLFVAGDAVADRPRTALEAARAGIVAGRRAAR